jgi:hypothetical protein
MSPRRVLTDLPFDTLEKTFDLLVTGPQPLALDTTPIAGLPNRAVPLGELKGRLLPLDAVLGARCHRRPARRPLPSPRRSVDRRPCRGAPPWSAPGHLVARASLPG